MTPSKVREGASGRAVKSAAAFRTISEVSAELNLPQHVLRFWETKFPQIHPLKRGGGRRYYRPEDVVLLKRIRDLLYGDGYTIKGVQKLLRENGMKGEAGEANARASPTDGGGEEGTRMRTQMESVITELEDLRDVLRRRAG